MKTVNRICQVLAVVFGLTGLVMFFMNFATIVSSGNTVNAIGAELAFGGKLEVGGETYKLAKSADILFCFILTVIATLMSAFSFKSKKLRYAAPAVGLGAAIYMLVIALSNATKFVDKRPLPAVTSIEYAPFVLIAAIALFAFAAAAIAYLLIDDYLEVSAADGKLTIAKRVVRFFRDYKSEVKKIVWPGIKDVVKNTLIVLIICLIIGAMIWLFDKGLGELLKLILTKN